MQEAYFYEDIERFGEAVKILRKRNKMTQDKLAGKAGVSKKYLREIEKGKHSVGLELMIRLCNAMEVNKFELLILAWEKEYREYLKVLLSNSARKERALTNSNHCENARTSYENFELRNTKEACGGGQRCYNEATIKNYQKGLIDTKAVVNVWKNSKFWDAG